MPNVTTTAPDGATISIPFTGTPLDQIHLAAALDHYTANSLGNSIPNYLGSLDITRSPDFALNSPAVIAAAPAMPPPRTPLPFTSSPTPSRMPNQGVAPFAPNPMQSATPQTPLQTPQPPLRQAAMPSQTATPSPTPPYYPQQEQRDALARTDKTPFPGLDLNTAFVIKKDPTPFLKARAAAIMHYTHLLQRGIATPTDTAQYMAAMQKNNSALEDTKYFLTDQGKAVRAADIKAGVYKPSGAVADFQRVFGMDTHEGTLHQGFDQFVQGAGQTASDLFEGTGDVFYTSEDERDRDDAQGIERPSDRLGATIAAPVTTLVGPQSMIGHGTQAAIHGNFGAFVRGVPAGIHNETVEHPLNQIGNAVAIFPFARGAFGLVGKAGGAVADAASIGGNIRQWDLTPPPDLQGLVGAAHAPMPTPFSPSLGPLQAYGPAAGQARTVIPDVGSKGGATRPPGGGRGPQPGSPMPPALGGDINPSHPPSPRSPVLNIATMPGSAKGQLYDDILRAHRRLVNSIINPRTGGIIALEEAGIPHRVLTTEGTSTTQRWGKEPNIHVELIGATDQTAKRAASILGKSFRQDGVGIHYSISNKEVEMAQAAIQHSKPLPGGLHGILSINKKDGSAWTGYEIDHINKVARRYNVELQTTSDGKSIVFHDYGSVFTPNPVRAAQDWQNRVEGAVKSAGLDDTNQYTRGTGIAKSDYVDQSDYRQHLAGNHQGTIKAAAKTHRIVFNRLTGQPSRQARRSMR